MIKFNYFLRYINNFVNIIFNNIKILYAGLVVATSLVYCYILTLYIDDNFQYKIVSESSSIDLPIYYKIFAPFATHLGSLFMLFFIYVIISCIFFYKIQKKIIKEEVFTFQYIVFFNLLLKLIFIFILIDANLFAKNEDLTNPLGLNILLQDYALLIHPPILYLSYTTSALVSSFVFIAIIIFNFNNGYQTKNNNFILNDFLKKILNFLRLSWVLNVLAVALGAAWGYREFSWGGYWSYDPIEILSLIIFIILTGFYHVLLIAIKTQRLIKLSFLFAVSTFFCIIFAFFASRSGALVSNHAFAVDKINFEVFFYLFGIFFISIIFGALKIKEINDAYSHKIEGIKLFSFVIFLQIIVLFFAIIMPIFYQNIFNLSISIEQSFFAYIFNPLIIPILFLMSFFVKEKKIYHLLKFILPIPIFLAILHYIQNVNYLFIVYLFLSYICIIVSIIFMKQKISGMLISHTAFILLVISITLNKTLEKEFIFEGTINDEKHFNINKDEVLSVKLLKIDYQEIDNFYSAKALLALNIDNSKAILSPELRFYKHQKNIITKSSIFSYLFFDLYTVYQGKSFNDKFIEDANTHLIYIYYRPMIFWIWISTFFMMFGSIKNFLEKK